MWPFGDPPPPDYYSGLLNPTKGYLHHTLLHYNYFIVIVKQYKTLKAGLFAICKQEQTEYIEVYLWHGNHGMKLLAYNFFCVICFPYPREKFLHFVDFFRRNSRQMQPKSALFVRSRNSAKNARKFWLSFKSIRAGFHHSQFPEYHFLLTFRQDVVHITV